MASNVISFEAYRQRRKIQTQRARSTPSAFFDLTEEEARYFAFMFSDPELDILAFNITEDTSLRVLDPDEFPTHPWEDSHNFGGESS